MLKPEIESTDRAIDNPKQVSGVLMQEYCVNREETCRENPSSFCHNLFSACHSDIMYKHAKTSRITKTHFDTCYYGDCTTNPSCNPYRISFFHSAGSGIEPIWIKYCVGTKFYIRGNVLIY